MHRQASNKFNTIKQGQRTVQELIQELTKYAARMVQYLDCFCNPSITNSSDQSLIGLSECSTFLVNHSLALPLSCVPKNCTWVSVYLTPSRPCSLSHHSIPAINISYTLRSELPEYSSGGLILISSM